MSAWSFVGAALLFMLMVPEVMAQSNFESSKLSAGRRSAGQRPELFKADRRSRSSRYWFELVEA